MVYNYFAINNGNMLNLMPLGYPIYWQLKIKWFLLTRSQAADLIILGGRFESESATSINFYNFERPHEFLGYKTHVEIYYD